MIHVLVPPGSITAGATIALDAEEAHHLDVRRAAVDGPVHAIDGEGSLGMGRLVHRSSSWLVEVEIAVITPRPAELVLAVGAGDRDRFLTVAEKAAELGVTRLVPLETELTRSVATRVRDGALERARRRARDGCKQSGNAWLPEVAELTPLENLGDVAPGLRWFLADAQGEELPVLGGQEPVGWLIGPEGGFTGRELAETESGLGARRIRLGAHILRYETAAIAAAVITDRARGESSRARRH